MKTRHTDSTFYSILAMRCPRCHEGKMFPDNTLYHPVKFAKMNDHCESCGLAFEPEPGYYFGAMFITYAINTAILVAVWLGLYLTVKEISMTMMLSVLGIVVMALLPITFRWSRVLWINIFVWYAPER